MRGKVVAAILLAAGESQRMGEPKPLLAWGRGTLIEYQISQLKTSGVDRVVVVLGHRSGEVLPHVEQAGGEAAINEGYTDGRASSLCAGAAQLTDATGTVIVLSVDQPRPSSITRRLLESHRLNRHLITVPIFEGRRGHPAVLDGSLLRELREVQEATQGLREVLRRHETEVGEVPFESDIVLLGMNTREEYEMAKRRYFQEAPR